MLAQKQQLFAKLVGQLIGWIYEQGWAVTFGDFARIDGHGHMANSCHYVRLAADLNLFVGGVYQALDCPEWQIIGAHWKGLDPNARWGGDFKSLDLNHVSLEHDGAQ